MEAQFTELSQDVQELKGMLSKLLDSTKDSRKQDLFGPWIAADDVKSLTGLSDSTLYRLRKAGRLRATLLNGRNFYYHSHDFRKLLDQNHRNL